MRRLRLLRLGDQAGDTIVEVMIVLAVLGLAFSVSYATANRGLIQSRNAEEHSEALGVLNTQVELVRTALAKQVTLPVDLTPPAGNTSRNFCMSDTTNPPTVIGFGNYTVPNNPKLDTAVTNTPPQPVYPAACVRGLYHTSVVYDTATGSYDFRIRWDGVGKLGRQQEEFNYKIKPVAVVGGFQDDPALQSPAINVIVQSIQPGPTGGPTNPTPSCSSTNVVNKSGTLVRLTGPTATQTLFTDGASSAFFSDLLDGGTYTVSNISRAGYGVCPGVNTAVAGTSSPVPVITRKIYPICTPHTVYSGYWAFGARHPELDGYYYTIPPAVASNTYPAAYGSFVAGPPYRWYVWSGDSSRAWQGLLYYWIWDAYWVDTTTTTYSCPS